MTSNGRDARDVRGERVRQALVMVEERRAEAQIGEPPVERDAALADLMIGPAHHLEVKRAVVEIEGRGRLLAQYHEAEHARHDHEAERQEPQPPAIRLRLARHHGPDPGSEKLQPLRPARPGPAGRSDASDVLVVSAGSAASVDSCVAVGTAPTVAGDSGPGATSAVPSARQPAATKRVRPPWPSTRRRRRARST